MAVYKPSQFNPSLEEIDVKEKNTFSCQVNTSGSSIQAYKMEVLSLDGSETIYEGPAANLNPPALNKARINIDGADAQANLVNGKDYQWGARVYDVEVGSTAQPKTLVCSGYLVGSTRYVLWTNTDNVSNVDDLVLDRWIEFRTTGQDAFLPVPEPNTDNMVLPTGTYRQRLQISWVETELGWNKNFIKIEMTDSFDYNYKDGTQFYVYLCSDEHTYNSVFCDPSDVIERGQYIEIYSGTTLVESKHKITGYSETTGEIRVVEPFSSVPLNGQTIKIYSYDRINDTYEEKTLKSSSIVGGAPVSGTFKILNNRWDSTAKRLFVQPNINIKSDATNPNEIVFDNNNARIDINKTTSTTIVPRKVTDTTFDRLDNTQWLLTSGTTATSIIPPITPKSYYKVYTDFMDAAPYSVFYARTTPTISIEFKNANEILNPDGTYVDNPFIDVEGTVGWRDIIFDTIWTQAENVEIKYYHYYLYHGSDEYRVLIGESEDVYNADRTWVFKGLASGTETSPEEYTIKIEFVDQYDKKFSQENTFGVYYQIITGVIPLDVSVNCDEHGITVIPIAPVYALSENVSDILQTVTDENLDSETDYLHIPATYVLNYTHVEDEEETRLVFTPNFSYFTQFQLTKDFFSIYSGGQQSVVFKISHATKKDGTEPKDYILKIGSFEPYYLEREVTEYRFESEDGSTYLVTSADDIALVSFPQEHTDLLGTHSDGSVWTWDGFIITITYEGKEYTINKEETKYSSSGVYRLNKNVLKFRLYEEDNEEPLKCFDGKDYYDIVANDVNKVLKIPTKIKYALQSASYGTYKTYDYLPRPYAGSTELERGVNYMSVNDIVYNGVTYKAGIIYQWNGLAAYNAITDTEYIYIETLDQVEGATYESLGVPENAQYEDGNTVGWRCKYEGDNPKEGETWDTSDDNIWVDGIILMNQNLNYLITKWFKFYMTVIDGTVKAYIEFSDDR